MAEVTVRGSVGDKELSLSTGKYALLADGAVHAAIGDTQILTTATASRRLRENQDFFPLTVDVEERMYAVGRIPGSFFRREGRATEKAILTCRLIDRPLRPSFKTGFLNETHVLTTVLSIDQVNPYDVIALNASSAALSVSPIPFEGPIGAVRLGLIDGDWVAMPTEEELEQAVFELVVCGKRNDAGNVDIVMVEAGATENGYRIARDGAQTSDEATVNRGLDESKAYIGQLIDLQNELVAAAGPVAEIEWPLMPSLPDEVVERVTELAASKVADVIRITDKTERNEAQAAALEEVIASLELADDDDEGQADAKKAFKAVMKNMMRARVIDEGIRMDGRGTSDIRELTIEVGTIPQGHGSAMFKRGETQVLNVTTLGMLRMEQMLDTIATEESKRYMHHYNFPPFATGETGFMRGPKRREIGHGALAEKALFPVIPSVEDFPYAFRLVSEVLMSNGSSSMASVCGSSLSLMDAGVPIHAPVAGIAMGLIADGDNYITLTDILGAEDALGDMDFKVAGTRDMITALQLDMKIEGLPSEVLATAVSQAREARITILDAMAEVIAEPREELAANAPKIEAIMIPKDRIGEVIGPKGKVIRELEEETGATIEIEDDGTIRVGASDTNSMNLAKERILAIGFPPEAEVGKVYEGEVVNITPFGAFVNILVGRDGLLHISKMGSGRRVGKVEDVLELGDKINVVVREIDDRGKVSLDLAEGVELEFKPGASPVEGGGDGGGRDRDRGRSGGGGRDGGGGGRDRGRSGGGGRDRGRSGGGGRDGGGGGSRTRSDHGGGERSSSGGGGRDSKSDSSQTKPGRTVVSFEDEFEGGS